MNITLDVKEITILESSVASDKILIDVNLPASCWTFQQTTLVLSFSAASGSGKDYVKKHFNIEPKVVCIDFKG